mmetsp:Transcript_8740/g.32303  ORF Transcript_8740/g.32303 Transcript_8740/m.32303 type:complete len:772 (-) Transcript_8740:227-2542(-)
MNDDHPSIEAKLDATLNNLFSLIFALSLGAFTTYVRILPASSIQYFSSFLFYVCLPLLLFSEIATAEFESYAEVLTVLGVMIGANLLMYLVTGVCCTILHRSFKTGAMLALCTTFSSSIFLSMPMVKALDKLNNSKVNYSVYCSLAFFLWDFTLVPISVLIFEIRQRNRKKRNGYFVRCTVGILRALLNPITLPIALGLVFFTIKEIFHVQIIPSFLLAAFQFLGDVSSALSVFIMGMGINGKELLGSSLFESVTLILLKQTVMPLIVVGLLRLVGFTDKNLLTSLYLTNASPPAQTIFLLSIQYGNVALLQVSSCLVLGVFFFFPQLYLSVSFFQLEWKDLITPVDLSHDHLLILLRRSNMIMNICTIVCGVLTLLPFIINKNYRVKLRRCVNTLTIGQIGASVCFMLPAIIPSIVDNPVLCTIQGAFLQFFVFFSTVWYLFTSTQMVMDFVFNWSGGVIREIFYHATAFVLALVTAVIPFIWKGYGSSGAPWCWVQSSDMQFILLYVPFLLFSFIGFQNIVLIQISERIRRNRNKKLELPESFKKAKVALLWKCRVFVLGFFFVWIFGVINRFIQWLRPIIDPSADTTRAYFLPLWFHTIFSCGQGLLNFLIFATGSQIMKDYRVFVRKIVRPLKHITKIPELLTGRGGTHGISGGSDSKGQKEENEDDDEEGNTFLFSPSVMRRYSVVVSKASALTDLRQRRTGSESLRKGLLDHDFENHRELEMDFIRPEVAQSETDSNGRLKEVSSDSSDEDVDFDAEDEMSGDVV